RDADGDRAGIAGAALEPREVALERRDLPADLALLHLDALHSRERLAAALLDQLDDGAERPGVGHRRGLLAGRAQPREELRDHLRRLGFAIELGLAIAERLDALLELCLARIGRLHPRDVLGRHLADRDARVGLDAHRLRVE